MAKKNGNRSAVSTKPLEFHNPGHAAQSRYVAALVNPFAAPPIPIPDSFLTAHCAKIAKELVVTGVSEAQLSMYKSGDSPTGDYTLRLETFNNTGGTLQQFSYVSTVGCRWVAAGIHYENATSPHNISGIITKTQVSRAYKNGGWETAKTVSSVHRDTGEGNIRYTPLRRQELDFEGQAAPLLTLKFSTPFSGVLRWACLAECDGDEGFTESFNSNVDFVSTAVIANHHAGQFADTPLPDVQTTSVPHKHTTLQRAGNAIFHSLWGLGSNFVSTAAGWASKNPLQAFDLVKKLPYVGSMMASVPTIASMETAAIEAAPSLLMLAL